MCNVMAGKERELVKERKEKKKEEHSLLVSELEIACDHQANFK